MGERYYDPTIGRFTQLDPLGNGYTYAGDNPVNFVDPSGFAKVPDDRMYKGGDPKSSAEEDSSPKHPPDGAIKPRSSIGRSSYATRLARSLKAVVQRDVDNLSGTVQDRIAMSGDAGMEDMGGPDADARRERRRQERQRRRAEWEARLDQLRPLSFEELTQIIEAGVEIDRAVAVDAIAEKDDNRALPLFLDILEHTEDDSVRDRAALGLYNIGDQRAFEPLLRTIRREYRGQGGVGTLLFALLSLDARRALVDVARILCDGTGETFESAWEAFAVIQHMTSPLPADAYSEALEVLNECLEAGGHPDWKQHSLEDAIEHIERCGDDGDHLPSDLCSICSQPVAVRGNDPVALDVLPRYWLARTEDQTLETYICHEDCLLGVLHPVARAALTQDLAELSAPDSL